MLLKEHQFEIQNLENESRHKLEVLAEERQTAENLLRQELRAMEKEKDRSFKDLQLIKQQIKFKESDVKSEMERVWSEWQEKHDFVEEELANLKQRLQT